MADRLNVDVELLRRLERLNIIAKGFLSARGPGKRETRNKGASLEFHEYRHYVPGDELRYLDWNVYARHDSLFIKEFTAEENVHVAILIDQSASMSIGSPSKFDAAKLLAITFGYVALANFDAVSVWLFSDRLSPVRSFLLGKARIHEVIAALEGARAQGPSDFVRAFGEPLPRIKGRSVILVLSDFYDVDGYARALTHLASQKVQIDLLQILTREEADPAEDGRLLMRDAESGRERELVVSARGRDAYRARFKKFLNEVEAFARSKEIRMIRAYTDELLEAVVARAAHGGFLERV